MKRTVGFLRRHENGCLCSFFFFCHGSLTSVERVLTNLLTSLNIHPQGIVVFDRLIVPKEVCRVPLKVMSVLFSVGRLSSKRA